MSGERTRLTPNLDNSVLQTQHHIARSDSLNREHSQADIEKRDKRHAGRKTCQNKFLSMLEQFSKHGVRSQIEKSAAYVRHD